MDDSRSIVSQGLSLARRLADQFSALPQVVGVVLAGSRGSSAADGHSDLDLYVYSLTEVPTEFRLSIGSPKAEIDNRFWETGDEWIDTSSGLQVDVMYRSPGWIEDQLDRVLVRHEASLGYSTCLWYNICNSSAMFDPGGWYGALQLRAQMPYPDGLQQAIIRKNHPVLRTIQSSYRKQIMLALKRNDVVSVQHRMTAVLASFFDIWFALRRQPHPGEKRLLDALPEAWRTDARDFLECEHRDLPERLDRLMDRLDREIAKQSQTVPD